MMGQRRTYYSWMAQYQYSIKVYTTNTDDLFIFPDNIMNV